MDGKFDDPEIEALANEVARLEGSTPAEAVKTALLQRKTRLGVSDEERIRRTEEIIGEIHEMPVLDARHPDQILYDENGLPK